MKLLYMLIVLTVLGCANLIPKVKLPFWGDLKPVQVLVPEKDKCYSGILVFHDEGDTTFENIKVLDKKECDKPKICFTRDSFDEDFQWNLYYIEERWSRQ